MVNSNLAYQNIEIEIPQIKDEPVKWCSVSLSDVIARGKRLEASVFDVEAKQAWQTVINNRFGIKYLGTSNGLIDNAYYPGRFKRIYCSKGNGVAFYLPSQMTDVYPKPDKYISKITKCSLDELRLKAQTLLLTRSGTIGTISYVSKTLENTVFSDDVIRVTFKDAVDLGYTYTFLKSSIGQKILTTNGYGSVITHLEPEHLNEIPIPNAPTDIKQRINNLIIDSYRLRDESNELIDNATQLLIDELHLPDISEFEVNDYKKNAPVETFSVKLSDLNGRADASYHLPIVGAIVNHLRKYAEEVTTVGDERISSDIILPGRFKRVYVDKEYGVRFLGGKELNQLDPSTEKYLSKKAHANQLKDSLGIKPNSLLTPARGSLGEVVFPPKHFIGWAISDNLMQILSFDSICGYLYIFLNTEYGKTLIQRFTYGGVVDAIEPEHIKQVAIPLLKNKSAQKKINDLALEANQKRYESYKLEQQALKTMDNEVIFAK
ncbi:MAG: restriction endonuclease subunit S [Candidatus Pseudoruminococcus sp.]|nr:restriction endonuclease subunit S [Ruminococcus bromii]MDY2782619.1 restriction endonuclease subunit S [Candidatus Pseudoruminococcus sp.]